LDDAVARYWHLPDLQRIHVKIGGTISEYGFRADGGLPFPLTNLRLGVVPEPKN
jgi:hypothetical protein